MKIKKLENIKIGRLLYKSLRANLYECLCPSISNELIIKFYKPELTLGWNTQLIKWEIDANNELIDINNIAKIFGYYKDDCLGYGFIFEKYKENILKTELSEVDGIKCITTLLDVITSVHNKEFVHFDIKPENIFKNHLGEFFLGDLGSARRTTINAHRHCDLYHIGLIAHFFNTGKVKDDYKQITFDEIQTGRYRILCTITEKLCLTNNYNTIAIIYDIQRLIKNAT